MGDVDKKSFHCINIKKQSNFNTSNLYSHFSWDLLSIKNSLNILALPVVSERADNVFIALFSFPLKFKV